MISKRSFTHSPFSLSFGSKLFLTFSLCLIFVGITHAQITTAAFLQDISSSTTLTTSESSTRTKILTDATISSYWVTKVNPIENYLTGKHLSFTLPGSSRPISFDADYVSSKPDGSYHWVGYAANGSSIDLSKFSDGSYLGGIFNGYDNSRYQILSLSTTKCLLIKYASGISTTNSCANEGNGSAELVEGNDEDIEVEDRTGCEVNLIRVLFLFTPAAAATGFNPTNVASGIIDDLTAAAAVSGIPLGTVGYHNAGVFPISFTESTIGDIFADRAAIIANTTAQNLRNANYADIVVLLTGPAYGTMLGRAMPDGAENAYAVVVINGAAGPAVGSGFTGTHEIGHLENGRHNYCDFPACQPGPAGCDNETVYHGYIFTPSGGTAVATIMTQNQCGAPRILRWSNPNVSFMGTSTGAKFNREYRAIEREAPVTSCYRSAPPSGDPMFGLDINGNPTICSGSTFGIYSASVSSFNLVYPLTYSWEISATGTGGFTQIGTGQQLILTSVAGFPNPFFLRVTVTDYGMKTATTQRSISIVSCAGGGADDRAASDVNAIQQSVLHPNPTSGVMHFFTANPLTKLKITDSNGRLLQIAPTADGTNWSFDLSELSAGIYYLHATENTATRTFKVVKL